MAAKNKNNNQKKSNNSNNRNRKSVDIKTQIKKVDVGVKGGVFIFSEPLSLQEVASKLNKSTAEIIMYFFKSGLALNLNTILSIEQIGELCLNYDLDFKIEKEVEESNVLENIVFDDKAQDLKPRPPVITIMGHVDHGKTTLLDTIRKTNVTASESGGITQHIGAYQVQYNGKLITFIDTPGHEAFTEMRLRGANITDIVIIVAAADDGIMPQTIEAINHAKAAKAPIIVFINKMDREGANPDRILSQLADNGITPEEWGGDTPIIKGSAKNHEGIDELLETILATSEMLELKANPDRLAFGSVIESRLSKGHGPVATVLVANGTLVKGDFIVVGGEYGRVRMMYDENDKEVMAAPPSKPVKITGIHGVPEAGDKFLAFHDEKDAKNIARKIHEKKIRQEQFERVNSDIRKRIADGELKSVNIILKSDVQGSLDAIKQTLNKINIEGSTPHIVHAATGPISESDIRLAQVSDAIIVSFNIKASKNIRDKADSLGVPIYFFDIVYRLQETIESLLKGVLDPIIEEEILGEAEVLQIWTHSEIGTICGSRVTSGIIKRGVKCRVIRNGQVIYSSEISSLRHGKQTITEAKAGNECGFTIKNYNDVKVGDIIEAYLLVEKTYDEAKK